MTLPKDSPRGGVLTQGSVLVSTSTPTRTSPVIRGKWILEEILGTPPPPPPPDVPPLQERSKSNQTASVRQRLEQHRSRPECAGCHAKMDPLGFALENFDATGAWRDSDGKLPVDASGKLLNGTAFSGPRELKRILKGDKKFVRCLTQKMLTYALGRGLERYDKCTVEHITAKIAPQGNRFSALVTAIVTSVHFPETPPGGCRRRIDRNVHSDFADNAPMNSATTRLPQVSGVLPPLSLCDSMRFQFFFASSWDGYTSTLTRTPLGEESHSGLIINLIAIGAAAVGIWAYLTCPPKPRIQKYLALFLCALNVWLGADTLTKYLLFGVR